MDNLNLITSDFVFSVSDVPLPAWNVKIFLLINKINSDMISLEKQISDDDEKWLIFHEKFSSADEVYESIYKQAKSSIYVVDNYIGLRTLVHLKNSPTGVNITLIIWMLRIRITIKNIRFTETIGCSI